MGTRSLTRVMDEDSNVLVCMYKHWDGYPECYGGELAQFLKGKKIVNGLTLDPKEVGTVFNGMGCLAASLVAHFKIRPGDVYLKPACTEDIGEEYLYNLTLKVNKEVLIAVWSCTTEGQKDTMLFCGTAEEFLKTDWTKKENDDDSRD